MPKGFKQIRQKKISDQVLDQIRDMIQSGKLSPDEKLMPERDLAQLLKVSRSSVREALLKLEILGLIELRHGEGTFIRSVAEEELNPVFETFLKNRDSILDLMEMRSVLEAWSARTAAARATPRQIARLRQCLEGMQQAKQSGKVGYESNLEFHRQISLATHNTLLVHVMNIFAGWFQQVTAGVYQKLYDDPELKDILFRQHKEIVDAIAGHDEEAAYQAMAKHLAYARRQLEDEG